MKINKKQKDIIGLILSIIIFSFIFIIIGITSYYEKKYSASWLCGTFITFLLVGGFFYLISIYKQKKEDDKCSIRKRKIKQYIQKNNFEYLEKFPDPIKQKCIRENFFDKKENLSFIDVIKLNQSNNNIYIGELNWVTKDTTYVDEDHEKFIGKDDEELFSFIFRFIFIPNRRRRGRHYRPIRVPVTTITNHYQTMGLLIDDSFFLPEFQLTNETLKFKLLDLLNLNMDEYKDIDFNSDKKFSDKWFLSSIENDTIVRDFFNNQIRTKFNDFNIKDNYIICGKRNYIFILSYDPVDPEEYSYIAENLIKVRDILKLNKKYYKEKRL